MRLRLFRAETLAAAMSQVRGELGGEALILGTRRVTGGVEVTAGLEPQEAPAPAPLRGPAHPALAPYAAPPGAGDREAALAWHGVPEPLRRRLCRGPLPFALSVALRFAPLPIQPGAPPLLLVGPPGAGKTLTVARLATRLVLAGTRPLVLTADGRRAGACEQLAAFTRLLGLQLASAGQPQALADLLAQHGQSAPVLIDCYGTDPFARSEMSAMRALAEAAGAEVVAVLPAGHDAAESADMAAAYQAVQARLLVATRLDVARRLGGVLAAAGAGLALAEFGTGPGAADGLAAATPARLAERLLPEAGFLAPLEDDR